MNTTEHILLIILASALGLLLILAIAAFVALIRLIKTLRHVAQTAESVIESAESVTNLFRKASGPVTVLNFVRGVANAVAQHKDKEGK